MKQQKNRVRFSKGFEVAGLLPIGAAASVVSLIAAQNLVAQPFPASPVGTVFVIAMENHNFTQPTNMTSPQQIFGNPAAPFINSLLTPGNPNAAQVSYATAYYNAGLGVHPSEPNYIWAEAGTDFGVRTDADPLPSRTNTFHAIHLTTLLNAAGVSWKNYEEDVQLSASPTNSVSGTGGPLNAYNGSTQYNYAVKHNPMAFFADTSVQNVYPLSQFFTDLANNAVGRYNWITPDQYNDAHTSLSGGFTYQGIHYTGDSANIAQGDNFLAQVIPQIMASPAYQNNGVIVIWWDESEDGDDTVHTVPEIVISPLAKGNAYASSVPMNHSSDIKTWEEIFGLPYLNNPIVASELNNFGGYNNVATVNDLSDLFVPGTVPAPELSASVGQTVFNPKTQVYSQTVLIRNEGSGLAAEPLWLVLDDLSAGVTLLNADGSSSVLSPLGSPYISVPQRGESVLGAGETRSVTLQFSNPSGEPIIYTPRVLSVVPAP